MASTRQIPAKRRGRPATGRSTVLVNFKAGPELRRRIRVAAAEDGLTYAQLFDSLLNERDEREARRKAQMASPLHRPRRPRLADLEMPGR